jgi:hypothetical protein
MLYELTQQFRRQMFLASARGILRSPPLRRKPASLKLVSMVCARDLEMYLLAIKSAYLRIGEGDIVCIDDGSLSRKHREALRWHLDDPEIVAAADIDTGPLPRNGCWERLVTCLTLSAGSYVIQVDADTLSLGDMQEVMGAYRRNHAFTQGESGLNVVPCTEASAQAHRAAGNHLQTAAERLLDQINYAESKFYVRGCAGFAGFPRGRSYLGSLHEFSKQMETLLGAKRWSEWGSEQVASNFVIANSPGAVVLPHLRYALHGWSPLDQAVFVHFIGTNRFRGGTYARLASRVLEELSTVQLGNGRRQEMGRAVNF